ncbi:hypothetical protein BD311DRAFT_796321 [Dichomitus squalens]|uniref:F-box domain-containing protein n=1 Tax=Dichomitus squalens TaxID=114155 RepID=A0A4Q9MUQ2_9APHY|nr:hypothetical protein BD311DRAFT_796321 [Dichomitus squalens]
MEHALTITEIREMICTSARLARLARTCKAFHEPSIQVLWCYLPDISPLFHCFAQDAYAYTGALYHLSVFHPTLVLFPNLVIFEWCGIHTNNRSALKVLQCNGIPVTEDGLLVLSRLPNLNNLAIRLPRSFTLAADTDSLDGLASLRDITVTAMIPDYIHFSNNTALPRVASMRIQVEGTSDNGDILRSFTSIRTKFSPAMITKLSVTDEQPNHKAVICLPYLQPLFELSNLAVFELSMAARYVLDGAAYAAIAQAWPLLESIDIGVAIRCVHDKTLSVTIVDALLPFAVHCPKLTHLGVWFNNWQLFDSWIPERPAERVARHVAERGRLAGLPYA